MKQFLKARGYKNWSNKEVQFGVKESYQKRMDILSDYESIYPVCSLNDKLFINIEHHYYTLPNNPKPYISYVMYLVHENQDGDWCDLKIYSLTEEKLMCNLVSYEKKLLDMWKVFYGENK